MKRLISLCSVGLIALAAHTSTALSQEEIVVFRNTDIFQGDKDGVLHYACTTKEELEKLGLNREYPRIRREADDLRKILQYLEFIGVGVDFAATRSCFEDLISQFEKKRGSERASKIQVIARGGDFGGAMGSEEKFLAMEPPLDKCIGIYFAQSDIDLKLINNGVKFDEVFDEDSARLGFSLSALFLNFAEELRIRGIAHSSISEDSVMRSIDHYIKKFSNGVALLNSSSQILSSTEDYSDCLRYFSSSPVYEGRIKSAFTAAADRSFKK